MALTRDIWESSLVRGPWKDAFNGYWQRFIFTIKSRESQLAGIRNENPNFTQKCKEFICDLRTYRNPGSHNRLDQTGHEFDLGLPYFEQETVSKLIQLSTMNGTLADELRLSNKRMSAEICASHDLSPIFEAALGVSWDKVREKALTTQHKMTTSRTNAEGTLKKNLTRKSSQFFGRLKGKKG